MKSSKDDAGPTLEGKVAFVTGGTGAVGQQICRLLLREGAKVAFSFLKTADKAAKMESGLGQAGVNIKGFQLDVRDKVRLEQVAHEVEESFGGVDILVNNAGVAQVMPFALIEEEDWDLMMDVNVKGMFLTTQAFVKGMIRRRRGNIVNVGSLAGMRVMEVPVHYATAKSAVVGFTLSLAREIARYNIRVNAVIPGLLEQGVGTNVPERQQEEYRRHCTLSRLGTPEEVAELVVFLASERSGYINAQAIFVDGGI
ncbi:SDR family oxidoreductase [bacterium]|nr:SDR family oxidoreductase [bacterium]